MSASVEWQEQLHISLTAIPPKTFGISVRAREDGWYGQLLEANADRISSALTTLRNGLPSAVGGLNVERAGQDVDDEIRDDVDQDEIGANEPILQLSWQSGKDGQHVRRCRYGSSPREPSVDDGWLPPRAIFVHLVSPRPSGSWARARAASAR